MSMQPDQSWLYSKAVLFTFLPSGIIITQELIHKKLQEHNYINLNLIGQ